MLGVAHNASRKQIKKAYRVLAQKYHPDINNDDIEAEEKMKQINQAYEVLMDHNKRTQYDRNGVSGFSTTNSRWGGLSYDDDDPGLRFMMMLWQMQMGEKNT
nr:DnaJ domain-containing protein [Pelotomaculum schinkii]